MKKKWVVVIPCGLEVIPTIEAAKKQGYSVAGVDQNPEAPAMKFCDLGIVSPLNDFEHILYVLQTNKIVPECVIPIVSDKAVFPAYMLNLQFGKTPINPNILAFYSKSVLRNTLNTLGFDNPFYFVVDKEGDLKHVPLKSKLIIKPDDSSGSRGITILEKPNAKNLKVAYQFALGFSANKKAVIEEYIPGEEYMVDCFVHEKEVKALLVSRKEKIQDKVSILIQTVNEQEFPYAKLRKLITKLSKALTYPGGPLHIEVKFQDGKFYILDLAARGGGFSVYNYYVKKCLGFDFVQATLDVFLQKKLSQKCGTFREGLIYFITPEKAGTLNNLTTSFQENPKKDVLINYYFTKGQSVSLDVTDGNRLAGIYCFAKNKQALEDLFLEVKSSFHQTYA